MPSRKHAPGPIANATFRVHAVQRVEHREIPIGEDVGVFAPYRGPRVCQSRAGRWRPEHCPDADDRCIYCDCQVAPKGAEG